MVQVYADSFEVFVFAVSIVYWEMWSYDGVLRLEC